MFPLGPLADVGRHRKIAVLQKPAQVDDWHCVEAAQRRYPYGAEVFLDFAKSNVPVIEESSIVWEPYSTKTRKHLEIGSEQLVMQNSDIFEPVVSFWTKVWEKVPPKIHLWRSETWKNSSLYTDIHMNGADGEL